MGSKVIMFLGYLLALVFLVSSQVAAARELGQSSNTIITSEATPITYKPIQSPPKPYKRRKCNYKNKCGPPL
ncbi:hypothetical protein C2S51_034985 [Perilla frutescens var. frutescens]|nr:hypothetical protein C2S51_034985 [Perilla frutescens var. frutescens]